WGVAGDPREIPFEWPDPKNPLFGFVIRDEEGMVWPGVYGPIPGTDRAKRKAGQAVEFHFRVLAQAGDWYAGFRTVADEVFQLRDYRQNHGVSLTQAALNMVDLLKDDDRGGWWEEPKGWYQVETLNGVTHSVPATLLSLYRLTGDEEIYRRRALPILEYMLSRTTSHFSPTPDNTGHYPAGGMQGPVNVFGTTTFSGLWELTNRYTDAFRQIALPEDGVRPSSGHTQDFEEWAERYVLTGDTQDLEKAKELADQYLKDEIETPPTKDLGHHPFFLIQFTPNWEGLLRMYEVTGEKRYLDGAVFGARQVMTGMWSQPVIPDGDIMVHPSGSFEGDKSWLILYKGPERYRLGWPRVPGDTPTRKAPAWSVSNVGLGFEQPSTYAGSLRSLAGRIIYQAAWTPNFQRLGAYTGDPQFVTYARNATVGRWGTYPGYYVVGFTDLVFNPRYPYGGPDVSFIYYHHLPVHLSWTIDYLVAEAYRLSKSQIEFPSKRQTGYAYFNGRVYGHAPGKVFGEENCWIWLKRGIVDIDNQQINYLTAHNGSNLFLYLMNQSPNEEKAEITFSPELLGYEPQTAQASIIREGSTSTHLAVKDDAVQITLPGCGAALITLEGVNVSIPAHQTPPAPEAGPVPSYVNTPCDLKNLAARAAAIQMGPDRWDAYVWCTAAFNEAREVTLTYTLDGQTHKITDTKYPFEFSIPVENPASTFEFHIEGKTPEEVEFRSPASSLGGAHARK
ncbi:hypothetical protein HQ520_10010, partial [bacterium]|nr:hypothetical protein [bacterium]